MLVSKLFGILFSIKLSSKKQARQTVLGRSIESVKFAVAYILPAICRTNLFCVVALVSTKLTAKYHRIDGAIIFAGAAIFSNH